MNSYNGPSHPVNYGQYENAKVQQFMFNGKLITIKPPAGSHAPNIHAKFRQLTPIYTIHTFNTAPDGVYVYLLSDKGLQFNKVRSMLELRTMHRILATETDSSHVFIAGEIMKTGNSIKFNLMSGTFTLEILKAVKAENVRERERRMIAHIQQTLEHEGFKPVEFTGDTFIGPARMPVTATELENYATMGYNVRKHDPEHYCNVGAESKLRTQLAQLKRTRSGKYGTSALNEPIKNIEEKLNRSRICKETSTLYSGRGGRKTRKHRSR